MSEQCPACQGMGRIVALLPNGQRAPVRCQQCQGTGAIASQDNTGVTISEFLNRFGGRVFR